MEIKIGLGLPTNRGIKPKCAQSLLKLAAHSKPNHFIVSERGYNTAENRNWIAAQAIKKGCTHLLLVDDDMIYEPDSLERLLAHDKDIVGGVAYTKYEKQELIIEYLGEKLEDDLFKCKALGGGLLLIKTDVFRKIPQPWFGYKWNGGMVKMSNDWFFCEKAREAGFDIWCDFTLSVKHIGEYEY